MTRKERYEHIVAWFEENMPVAETELHYDSPFHLLIAVILSAQCTDRRVNMTTPAIFEAYPVRCPEIERTVFYRAENIRAELGIVLNTCVRFHLKEVIHYISSLVALQIKICVIGQIDNSRLVCSGNLSL